MTHTLFKTYICHLPKQINKYNKTNNDCDHGSIFKNRKIRIILPCNSTQRNGNKA